MLMMPTDEGAGAVAYISKPAVVDGEKAVEAALAEGLFPIIDKTVDVFAVPSAEGTSLSLASFPGSSPAFCRIQHVTKSWGGAWE